MVIESMSSPATTTRLHTWIARPSAITAASACRTKNSLTLSAYYVELNRLPETLSENEVDWDYIREFERKYCKRYTLLELAAMDPIFSSAFHHRKIYYRPENKAIFFKMLELKARWLEGVFGALAFDAVFTVNFQYFVKAALFTMAEAKSIPFLVASSCRLADLQLLYDNFSLGTPGYIVEEMERLKATADDCREAKAHVKALIADRKPAYIGFERTLERISVNGDSVSASQLLLRKLVTEWQASLIQKKHYRGIFKQDYYLPGYVLAPQGGNHWLVAADRILPPQPTGPARPSERAICFLPAASDASRTAC